MSAKVEDLSGDPCAECAAGEQAFMVGGRNVRRIVHAYGCAATLDWALYGDAWTLDKP